MSIPFYSGILIFIYNSVLCKKNISCFIFFKIYNNKKLMKGNYILNRLFIKIILIFIFFTGILFSQTPEILKRNFFFCEGSIGEIKVYVYIYLDDKNITGKYYYDTIKQFINLEGTVSGNTFNIKETVNNRITGYFSGTISDNSVFSGEWSSYDGNNKYDFNFSKKSSYPINSIDIITSVLKADEEGNRYFESVKDAIIIKNDKNSNPIDKISLDVDGIKSLNENRIHFLLNSAIMDEYGSWKEELNDNMDFYIKREIEVSFLDDKIISFSIYNYSYTGGMHGIYNSIPSIYLISTGERVGRNISELIENKNDRDLINLMRSKLLRNFNEKDFFDFYSIELSDTFDITPTGIKFIWPVYKIAGYAQGIIEADFTYLELKPFIKKDSVFWYLFEK